MEIDMKPATPNETRTAAASHNNPQRLGTSEQTSQSKEEWIHSTGPYTKSRRVSEAQTHGRAGGPSARCNGVTDPTDPTDPTDRNTDDSSS
ncbi:hypothetical protein EYF80_000529 [Liparis tanakae]|uniref:Uncharacterized protein n=1 Tax=Liparis tanakae TaxID=230148 RepID=A0A4Z2JH03_9TELE|nr:hypothetical protein EYF80_000529 [Liparis tanakae]